MADVENQVAEPCPKQEECVAGLPMWMATFSDLVTLLLTFFVLLLSFAKTETSKYKAALGSIREAFGGNVHNYGEPIVPGKSPDDSPTMIDAQEPVMPFPIEFLTTEGILDKHEINRSSEESLIEFKSILNKYSLQESVEIHEMNEGIKVHLKDKIFFAEGDTKILQTNKVTLDNLINLLRDNDWVVYVQGYSAKGENSTGGGDAYTLSARRSTSIGKYLIQKGIKAEKVISVSFGDSRQQEVIGKKATKTEIRKMNRRVEFLIRKRDINDSGRNVSPY